MLIATRERDQVTVIDRGQGRPSDMVVSEVGDPEARLDAYRRERAALAARLARVRSEEAVDSSAGAVCRALVDLGDVGVATLVAFAADGTVSAIAAVDATGADITMPGSVPQPRSVELRARAAQGPWLERWDPAPWHPYRRVAADHDVGYVAYAPLRDEDDVIGLLAIGGSDDGGLLERMPALAECAAFAGALLGPRLRSLTARELSRERIGRTVDERAFMPVFQPIVELATGQAVGFEALTRFVDGRAPDAVFAEAASCDMGLVLERATLEAVLEASAWLPRDAWLNLNVSADLVLDGHLLDDLLDRIDRHVVLELTEHMEIDDYAAVRAAVDRLGARARLAVDDAGAGFASLRHILELRPDYIKLDRGIVRSAHRDPARQALVAGLVHFAARTGSVIIGEGVECRAEARQLHDLGVPLAQGFWLGRPSVVARITNPVVTAPARPSVRSGKARLEGGRADDDIRRAVNIGDALGAALREVGVPTTSELRTQGAMTVWERLRRARPDMATGTTLLQLEGALRGVRITQLPPSERARLRLYARLGRRTAA